MAEGPAADPGAAGFHRAVAFIDGLTSGGLAHAVVSPGSRSTPLALAAARCGALRLHVVVDERAAAFFALGLARATGAPALVIATSGSGPGHWLPAAIEAAEDEVPLVLASADRPAALLGCGANQATDQSRLFGAHARGTFHLPEDASPGHAGDVGRRAGLLCRWPRPGPVHVNAAFREPLSPAAPDSCASWRPCSPPLDPPPSSPAASTGIDRALAAIDARPGAILAGRLPPRGGTAGEIAALARALDCPVVADPLSGLRSGNRGDARILVHGDAFLRGPEVPVPDWLLRVGAPPVSKHVEAWAARCPATMVVSAGPHWPDPSRAAGLVLPGDPAATLAALRAAADASGTRAADWRELDALEAAQEKAARAALLPREAGLMAAIADALPEGTPVFLGNSLVVRDADSFLPRRPTALDLYANRGVSGIDGNLATAAGIVEGTGRPGLAVVGDVTVFHDLSSLALVARVPLVLVVVNNGGGAIFGQLDQAALPEFDALWLTPTGLDLDAAARLFGLAYRCLDASADLASAIGASMASRAPALLELVVDREASAAARREWWGALT